MRDAEHFQALLDSYEQARTAWPGVTVDRDELVAFLEARLEGVGSPGELHVVDLYLACACLAGDRAALVAFEHAFHGQMIRALAKLSLSVADREDVMQNLRESFFVRRKLAKYSGRGQLRAWVRAAATRAGLDLIATRKPETEEDILGNLPATDNSELELLRRRFASEFRAAFTRSVASLAAADRTLLLQHYVDDLSIDQLAAHYGVHRATVARRVAHVRQLLLQHTEEALRRTLAIDETELASLMDLARSRLDVSIFRLLRGG